MVKAFDLRAIVLAKHAQHVVLIHFPIALFITGVAFDVWSRGKRCSQLAGAAYLNLCVAAWTMLPTVATGLLAWQFALQAKKLKGLLLWHLMAALLGGLLILASWWVHWRTRKRDSALLPRYRIALELLGIAAVVLTGHFGGFLTGVNN